MPVLVKPATPTALVTARLVERLLATGLLPEGALQLLVGAPGDLLKHLGAQDVVAFTGSSRTATMIRTMPELAARSVRVNVEADSLNASVLGPDVEEGSEVYGAFLADIARDITQKAGQKCTAIRRVFVPAAMLEVVRDGLVERLSSVRLGDPSRDSVQMGPVATAAQLQGVRDGIRKLLAGERVQVVTGGVDRPASLEGIDGERGFFAAPTLLLAPDAAAARAVHEHEVFGPCTTLMPYDGSAEQARGAGGPRGGRAGDQRGDERSCLRAGSDPGPRALPWPRVPQLREERGGGAGARDRVPPASSRRARACRRRRGAGRPPGPLWLHAAGGAPGIRSADRGHRFRREAGLKPAAGVGGASAGFLGRAGSARG
jgi:hypothetical protein